MTDKRKIIIAVVIVALAIIFIVLNPRALETFIESFNRAYEENAQEAKEAENEEEPVVDEFPVSISISAEKDTVEGFNVTANVQNFLFGFGTPPLDNLEQYPGKIGYGEVTVDGKLIGRMYQPWFYIPDLEPGNHEVIVRLFTQDNLPLIQDGSQVMANTIITEE